MCNLSNTNAWDTDKAVLIGVGIGSGGQNGLDGMINQDGANAPWVQDLSEEVLDAFLGENAPRRQIVLLDHNLEKQFQQQYGGPLNNQEEMELLLAIFLVYSSYCLIVVKFEPQFVYVPITNALSNSFETKLGQLF